LRDTLETVLSQPLPIPRARNSAAATRRRRR
jgi:hypothetical protein